jgi:hypothetical protein
MSLLQSRDPEIYYRKECHICGEAPRYVWKDQVWCRVCLDKEQYPELAHLTQDEREAKRWAIARGDRRGIINTVGFA